MFDGFLNHGEITQIPPGSNQALLKIRLSRAQRTGETTMQTGLFPWEIL